jgi:hypothetical protein
VPGLDELLGHDRLASRAFADLRIEGARVVRITGASGTGKTFVANLVGRKWRDVGGECVIAIGDSLHASRDLFPLIAGMRSLPRDWIRIAGAASRSVVDAAGSFKRAGPAAGNIFDLLNSTIHYRAERALAPYSKTQREVITDLRRIARSRPLLLIADNSHWWDRESLWMVHQLVSDDLRGTFPTLADIEVLLVDSAEEQGVVSPVEFAELASLAARATHVAERCRLDEYPNVLQSLGLGHPISRAVSDALYAATGGHLKLAEQVVEYGRDHSLSSVLDLEGADYLSHLLATRLDSLGLLGANVLELLARAAVIGLEFDERDLACVAGETLPDLQALIEEAERFHLFDRAINRLTFSHDIIRTAILRQQTAEQVRQHNSLFARCLVVLRPGDYAARAEVLERAGDLEGSREFLALAQIARLRRLTPLASILRDVEARRAADDDLTGFLSLMADAYASIEGGEFADHLPRLLSPNPTESFLMAAERNYVAALCEIELQTEQARLDALAILDTWCSQVDREPELALRFLQLREQALVQANRFEDARAAEADIERRLFARTRYDPDAPVHIHIQNRRSGSIMVPEVAKGRIADAVSFFSRGSGDTARDTIELFRSLTNLSAINLRLGEDSEAFEVATRAEELVLQYPELTARPDVLASNLVLAGLRSGQFSTSEAVLRQSQIVDSPVGGRDKFVHRCNLAAFLLLDRHDDEAIALLDALDAELQSYDYSESYLVYYLRALRVASAAVTGDVALAIDRHREMDSLVSTLQWPCASYVRRRQALLVDVLASADPGGDRAEFDRALLVRHPREIGLAWPYYGRVIPGCELSFWSDS